MGLFTLDTFQKRRPKSVSMTTKQDEEDQDANSWHLSRKKMKSYGLDKQDSNWLWKYF